MRKGARAFIIILLAATPLLAKSKAASRPVSVPFTISSSEMIMVTATVNGAIPIQVIFDTGAGIDVLAPSVIEKLHARSAGVYTGFRMTGERLDIPLFVIPELAIGPIVKKDQVVGSFDALDQLHIKGIISANDFRQNPFTLDFLEKVLIFETPKTLGQRRTRGKSSPLQLDDQRGIALDLFAQFLIGDQLGLCEIDTGSQNVTVSTRYMAPLGIEKDGKNVQRRENHTIAGTTITRYNTRLAQITLAAAPEIGVKNPGVSFSNIIYDCNVGLEFWTGRSLTIDIPGRQLLVSRLPPAP